MCSDNKATILIVDDFPENLKVLGSILKKEGYSPVAAQNGSQALDFAQNGNPDLILLDIMMPEMDGYEVCRKLKADERTKDIPVIFLTAKTSTEDIVLAFEVGGVDFVTRPFKGVELLTRVKCQIDLRREIKQRQLAQRKLEESEEQFRSLTEQSVVGICIVHDFIIQYANPRLHQIYLLPADHILNKNLLELVVEGDKPRMSRYFEGQMKGLELPQPFEFQGFAKEGDIIHLESYGTVIRYRDKPALLLTIIDITSRKKAQLELMISAKFEYAGLLSGWIAHDFNNLLAVIIGNLLLAKQTPENQERYIQRARKSSNQAAELIGKFLTISTSDWMIREKIDLPGIFSVMKDSSHLKKIAYTLSLPADLNWLYASGRQLRQILENLLLNAHEATLDLGKRARIDISAQNISIAADNEWDLEKGDYVQVSVADNGKGIPPELMDRIFDTYFSTKQRGNQKGMGLGLALCFAIVRKHQGHISIRSNLPKGTVVDVYLPVFQPQTREEDNSPGNKINKSRSVLSKGRSS